VLEVVLGLGLGQVLVQVLGLVQVLVQVQVLVLGLGLGLEVALGPSGRLQGEEAVVEIWTPAVCRATVSP